MEMKKNIFRVFVLAGLLCCGCRDGFTVRQALERAGENRPQLEAVLEHFKESGDTGCIRSLSGTERRPVKARMDGASPDGT